MSAQQSHSRAPADFHCLRLRAADPLSAELAVADAFAAGASGALEVEEEEGEALTFDVYASADRVDAVRRAIAARGVDLLSVSPVPDRDWSEAWKQDLAPIEVSPRLVVRPSFAEATREPGRCVLEIDPGQAFGTGAHESTRLALEGVDAIAGELGGGDVLLDVGTGTGVLALAALGLGCGRAVGFDLDPLAGREAGANARRNGLAGRLDVFVGGIEALAPAARFRAVVANLLLGEMCPLLGAMAHHLAPDGRLVLSGLLEEQAPEVESRAAPLGLRTLRALRRRDASGVLWTARIMTRGPAPSSRP
ncbi:MAG: 50S ribosomal protein L11 methyltransferase [Myxococcota bacterium]